MRANEGKAMKTKPLRTAGLFGAVALALAVFLASAFVAQAADAAAEATAPKTQFVKIGDFVLPVIRENQVTHHVFLAVSVEVTGDEKKAEVERMMPRVKDAMLRELYKHMSRRRNPDAVEEILELKQKLRKVGNEMLEAAAINAVLIENMLERKIL